MIRYPLNERRQELSALHALYFMAAAFYNPITAETGITQEDQLIRYERSFQTVRRRMFELKGEITNLEARKSRMKLIE